MATSPRTIDLLLERIAPAGRVTAKKMFGEYGLYCNDRFFAVVCDDTLFLKDTAQGREFAPKLKLGPPYPGAKPAIIVPADRWDDEDWFIALVRLTVDNVAPSRGTKSKTPRA